MAELQEANLPEPFGSLIKAAPIPDEVPAFTAMENRTGAAGVTDGLGLGVAVSAEATGTSGINTHLGFQDPPAWWTIRHKDMTYTDGAGQVGGYRTMMSTLTVFGLPLSELIALDKEFQDIAQYLLSLPAPRWEDTDFEMPTPELVTAGAALFDAECASCHAYPQQVVAVGTDPVRDERLGEAEVAYLNTQLISEEHAMTARVGYLAQPLIGIWASAPYLHNGSVPTLAALLDPDQRPDQWVASGEYDPAAVGLSWGVPEPTGDPVLDAQIHDASREGLGNQGHTFGASLTEDERAALLAYLKTL